ncbi:unnamed protein product [Sphagnum compactum]
MASLRRTLSSATYQEQEGFQKSCDFGSSPVSAAVVSQDFTPFLLALLGFGRSSSSNSSQGMGERVVVGKSSRGARSAWRRFPILLGMCFVVGLCAGIFTPYSWTPNTGQSFVSHFSEDIKVENMATSSGGAAVGVANALEETSGIGLEYQVAKVLEPRKLLIVVTPTYNRAFQAYYLTRLAHTLKLVPPPLLWLVVETEAQSLETASLLRETGIMYRHLVCEKNVTNIKDRGIHQRNVALAHIEHHQLDGIVYFADDDNVYTLELFEEMRQIRRFGTWLVGMLVHSKSKTILEGPVCDGEKVVGWHTNEKSKRLRRFHVDMSGFAFNSSILWDPDRWHRPSVDPIQQLDTVKEGFQETTFIEQLVADESQMEGRPPGCSKVMVWHLHLEAASGLLYPSGWTLKLPLTANLPLQQDA